MRSLNEPPYSYSCMACAKGRLWLYLPDRDSDGVRLCEEHETIVSNVPGWTPAEDPPGWPLTAEVAEEDDGDDLGLRLITPTPAAPKGTDD